MKTICLIAALVGHVAEGIAHGSAAVSAIKTGQTLGVLPPKDIETVRHEKKPNAGYAKGSPLYEKQQDIKASSPKKHKAQKIHVNAGHINKSGFGFAYPGFTQTLMSIGVYSAFVIAFAYFNRNTEFAIGARVKGDPPMKLPSWAEWTRCGFTYSLFDCSNMGDDWKLCLTSFLCPVVQWANTASNNKQPFLNLTYWKAVALMLTLTILTPFTYGISGLAAMLLLFKRRQELRKTFNHLHPESRALREDLCLTVCCNPLLCCQLVQEARESEFTQPQQTA